MCEINTWTKLPGDVDQYSSYKRILNSLDYRIAINRRDNMKILICGDRNWRDYGTIYYVIHTAKQVFGDDIIIIQGECRGADILAKQAAYALNLIIWSYPANWTTYGKAAGPIRNSQMLDAKPDLVIAFHNSLSNSKGTKNMVIQAHKRRIKIIPINKWISRDAIKSMLQDYRGLIK